MAKQNLAKELVNVRQEINQLKRRERLLRDYFIEDLEKYGKTEKRYGDVLIALFDYDRERIDLDHLHLHFPDLYNQLLSTYTYSILKCQRVG
jgi:hypothetical protein